MGSFTAVTENFAVNVTEGILKLNLSSLATDGGRDRAKISAIKILSNSCNEAFVANKSAGYISYKEEPIRKHTATVQPNLSNNYFNFSISVDNKPVEVRYIMFQKSGLKRKQI